jgi:hypothetical protein
MCERWNHAKSLTLVTTQRFKNQSPDPQPNQVKRFARQIHN